MIQLPLGFADALPRPARMTIGISTSAITSATVINVIGGAETISTTDRAKRMTASARMLTADPATSSYAMSEARVIGSISDADRRFA